MEHLFAIESMVLAPPGLNAPWREHVDIVLQVVWRLFAHDGDDVEAERRADVVAREVGIGGGHEVHLLEAVHVAEGCGQTLAAARLSPLTV